MCRTLVEMVEMVDMRIARSWGYWDSLGKPGHCTEATSEYERR